MTIYNSITFRAVIVDLLTIDVLTIWGFRYITDSKFWSIDTIYVSRQLLNKNEDVIILIK